LGEIPSYQNPGDYHLERKVGRGEAEPGATWKCLFGGIGGPITWRIAGRLDEGERTTIGKEDHWVHRATILPTSC